MRIGACLVCVCGSLRMSSLELAETRLTFDDILEAVQDSKRGRWFLQEFESRVQKRESQSILNAISKLENRMEQLGPQSSNPDDLGKVRAAIANARNDLFKLGMGKEALSKEGRLFAELADLARRAMPDAGDKNAGIVRGLQLVDEIDRTISPSNDDSGAKFFAADSNLFDRPVTVPKPVLVESASQPIVVETPKATMVETKTVAKSEPAPIGAKLVIRKAGQTPTEHPAEKTEAKPTEVIPQAVEAKPAPAPVEDQRSDNPRIVIIRRKAEDMPEVAIGELVETNTAA
jgi:hypothetical protein